MLKTRYLVNCHELSNSLYNQLSVVFDSESFPVNLPDVLFIIFQLEIMNGFQG